MFFVPEMRLEMICVILMTSWTVSSVDPQSGGTVQRLQSQQDQLIQPGLSFINNSNMASITMMNIRDIHNLTTSQHLLSASINIVNWSRWLLGYPVSTGVRTSSLYFFSGCTFASIHQFRD